MARILSDSEVFGTPASGRVMSDEEVFGTPKKALGAPEELSPLEKLAAKLPDWMAGSGGGVRGSAVGRLAMGAADPGVALVQMAANAVGAGDAVNKGIQDTEAKYQAARAAEGSTGFDPLRAVGNVAITAPLGAVGTAGKGVVALAGRGALQGAAGGVLAPVTEGEDFWTQKATQAGVGAAGGAVMAPAMAALARLVSPRASVNPNLQALREEGVQPTVGQALGGAANAIEEKLQSVPIMGDAISAARRRAINQFNEAAINRAVKPIGGSVRGSGQEAVAKAGDMLSDAYETAINRVKGVAFDTPEFNRDLGNLQRLTSALEPAHAARFNKALNDVVVGRMSPNGSMLGETFKKADSELGALAARYGKSPMAGEQELADAVRELQNILRQQVARSSPEFSDALKAADSGWKNLVRVENAATRAANQEGVFTPGQLNQAVRATDRSVRKRATARGTATMQDLSNAGQQVLGNKIPDSGTPGRVMAAGGALASGLMHPAIPAAAIAGAAAYAPPIQNMLVYLMSRRPDLAPELAAQVRRLAGPAAFGGGLIAAGAE